MPRAARLDKPGILHHVIIRGIERRKIFRDDIDRENFIERLNDLLFQTKTLCYAWALMPNHAHMLLRSGNSGISTLMRRLLTGYAVSFNRRHKRCGQLFQNRYRSIICQEDRYFHELVRYIHLNPMRVKIIKDIKELDNYAYCGHSALMGKIKREWQDTEYVLNSYGRRTGFSRKKYRSFIEEGIPMGRRPELVGGGLIRSMGGWGAVKKRRMTGQERIKGDQRILGGSDFVLEVLSDAKENLIQKNELISRGYTFEKIAERVCSIFEIEWEYIAGRGRQQKRVKARDLLSYLCTNKLGISMSEISRRLGLTIAAVSIAVRRGEKTAKEGNYILDI